MISDRRHVTNVFKLLIIAKLGPGMNRDFKKVRSWQVADDLTFDIYQITERFPKHELYGLTSQIRRSSPSVPPNITEGASRTSKKEYLQFLKHSQRFPCRNRVFPPSVKPA